MSSADQAVIENLDKILDRIQELEYHVSDAVAEDEAKPVSRKSSKSVSEKEDVSLAIPEQEEGAKSDTAVKSTGSEPDDSEMSDAQKIETEKDDGTVIDAVVDTVVDAVVDAIEKSKVAKDDVAVADVNPDVVAVEDAGSEVHRSSPGLLRQLVNSIRSKFRRNSSRVKAKTITTKTDAKDDVVMDDVTGTAGSGGEKLVEETTKLVTEVKETHRRSLLSRLRSVIRRKKRVVVTDEEPIAAIQPDLMLAAPELPASEEPIVESEKQEQEESAPCSSDAEQRLGSVFQRSYRNVRVSIIKRRAPKVVSNTATATTTTTTD